MICNLTCFDQKKLNFNFYIFKYLKLITRNLNFYIAFMVLEECMDKDPNPLRINSTCNRK